MLMQQYLMVALKSRCYYLLALVTKSTNSLQYLLGVLIC